MVTLTDGTIDLNLPELEYIADHLKRSECRKLVAVLHDPNFDIVNNIQAAERKIPDDLTCLKLLIHWNSQTNEGRGETHVVLAHRLTQIGREDLAHWLSTTVFHQLSQDLNKSMLSDPFKELAATNDTNQRQDDMSTTEEEDGEDEWLPTDTILCSFSIIISAAVMVLMATIVWLFCKKKMKKRTKLDKSQEGEDIYAEEEEEKHSSASETSIVEFDATAIHLL
ncbi:hypothetical protein L9F63_018101 [Diploptera punctata]|uniref:Death domain-containing protein n=1 Tax=Diploptera punctata TaxID=6984 RepID=A0AAD7ZXD2_DIPPU|nr:hypothetical protein L9F63_018101 [Diploptera punctata]